MRDDRERLADVLAAIDGIRRHVRDDRTRFDTDELLHNAVLRRFPMKHREAYGGTHPSPVRQWMSVPGTGRMIPACPARGGGPDGPGCHVCSDAIWSSSQRAGGAAAAVAARAALDRKSVV